MMQYNTCPTCHGDTVMTLPDEDGEVTCLKCRNGKMSDMVDT